MEENSAKWKYLIKVNVVGVVHAGWALEGEMGEGRLPTDLQGGFCWLCWRLFNKPQPCPSDFFRISSSAVAGAALLLLQAMMMVSWLATHTSCDKCNVILSHANEKRERKNGIKLIH